MKSYKEQLYDKHNQFDYSDIDEQRLLIKMEIKALVEELDSPDAQDYHILGLVFYDTSDDSHDIRRAHQYFLLSLEKDSKYNMARLYSAHCYHDLNDYENALESYLSVDALQLVNEFAFWRYIKLQEQIGFCYHKLGDRETARKYFDRLLEFYQRESLDTLGDPKEIFECLDGDDKLTKELKKLIN